MTFMGTQPHGNSFYADVAYFFKTLLPSSGFQVPVVQGFSVWLVLAYWVSTDCPGLPGPPYSDLPHVTALPHTWGNTTLGGPPDRPENCDRR